MDEPDKKNQQRLCSPYVSVKWLIIWVGHRKYHCCPVADEPAVRGLQEYREDRTVKTPVPSPSHFSIKAIVELAGGVRRLRRFGSIRYGDDPVEIVDTAVARRTGIQI